MQTRLISTNLYTENVRGIHVYSALATLLVFTLLGFVCSPILVSVQVILKMTDLVKLIIAYIAGRHLALHKHASGPM